jgi:predicted phosphoribosyltransferase
MRAPLQVVRQGRPRAILLAVPVAPVEVVRLLEPLVDRVVCLQAPRLFDAVGAFYREFSEVSDGEVMALHAEGRSRSAEVTSSRAGVR